MQAAVASLQLGERASQEPRHECERLVEMGILVGIGELRLDAQIAQAGWAADPPAAFGVTARRAVLAHRRDGWRES